MYLSANKHVLSMVSVEVKPNDTPISKGNRNKWGWKIIQMEMNDPDMHSTSKWDSVDVGQEHKVD